MIHHDAVATQHVLHDATVRPFVLGHMAGSGIAYLNLRYHPHKEIRLCCRTARELSHLLDHFARHQQLPTSFPREDYHI